jgi:AcrR family transcriptional regulator
MVGRLLPIKRPGIVKSTNVVKIPRPPKELRDQARRDKILEATAVCVVRHGFHAASMAEIAQTAGMSVGQIYRHFSSKEAIVHAIVERIVEGRLRWIATHNEPHDDLPTYMARRFVEGAEDESRDDRVLMLEVMAEATRSPAVAKILREADRRLRAKGLEMIRAACPGLTEEETIGRVELFAVLAEGTALRRVTGIRGEKELLVSVYRDVLERALAPARRTSG